MSQVRGYHSVAGYLFVYTEMEGAASVAGRPLGSRPRQDGGLHVPHSSQQLGHYGCLEKEAVDTAVDQCLYTTSGYCHQASVPFGRDRQRSKAETIMEGPFLGTRRCREPRVST